MPEQVRCPSCQAALRVPDTLLGKNVKCPKCQTTFLAEMEEPAQPKGIVREPTSSARRSRVPDEDEDEEEELPPQEEEEEERPRRRRRRRRRSAAVESAVTGPAISIMVVGGLSILGGIVDLVFRIIGVGLIAGATSRAGASSPFAAGQAAGQSAGVILGGVFDVLSMILPIVMLIGAVKMKNLQNYGLALTSCILSMLPVHCCCCLGLPFGIWGLVVLNKPEVKDAFS